MFLVIHNLSRCLWVAALTFRALTSFSNSLLSTNLLRMHSVASPGLLLKTLIRIGSVTDHGELVTDHYPDFASLIAALRVQLSQFTTHCFVCLYSPCLPNSVIRTLWEIVSKTSLKSMCATSTCFLLATAPIISSKKAVRKVRYDFHLLNLEKQVKPGKKKALG